VVIDPNHVQVKNPAMKLVEQLLKIPVHIRVIISGTPIQNNLGELRNLLDFCCEGLLGNARTFSKWVCMWCAPEGLLLCLTESNVLERNARRKFG
jgi:SNF2 family DNA or RNA helicase